MANEAVKFVWEGAIPLQIHLHKSEVASHPAPPPALVTHSLLLRAFFSLAFVFFKSMVEISGVSLLDLDPFRVLGFSPRVLRFVFIFVLNHQISIINFV